MRRRAVVMLAAVLFGAVAAAASPARPSAAVSCEGGLTSASLNDMIRGSRNGPGGMVGMDYAHVQRLPDGRVLWLFQDVFLGDVARLDAAAFVHNAGLIQFGSCVKVLHSGSLRSPRSWIGASAETPLSRWFWPLDGTMGADGLFHQFMVEMRNANGTGAAVGATPVRVWIASIRLTDLAVVSMTPAPDDDDRPLFGFSVTSDDDWTYLYGHCYRQFTNPGYAGAHDTSCGPDVYLARVPKGQVSASPEYWAGGGWSGDRSAATPIMQRGVAANPMQVRNVGGTFVSVTKIDDWFGLTVYIDVAASAEGPWTQAAHFSPDLVCNACGTYFAHLLPWRDSDGSMLVVISNNAWSHQQAVENPRYYRPRIMSVRAPEGVELPAPPADCVITSTLRPGSTGSSVRCLRRRLVQLGYPITVSPSRFDASVTAAVMAFQTELGLSADGIVGPTTGRQLGIRSVRTVTPGSTPGPRGCTVTSTLRYGSRGAQVSCLNARLKALGYAIAGAADQFGSSTRTAVKKFQAAKGLLADGIVGAATRRALGL